MKYLYGAAVQGIQQFIFQTNELKDIVGASELVENICTTEFAKELYHSFSVSEDDKYEADNLIKKLRSDNNAILNAAGNIKYIFADKGACEAMVKQFPRRVLNYAPGITISQAVVEFEDEGIGEAVNLLESRLRIQRNKPMNSVTHGLMGIHRSRNTNMPSVMVIEEGGKEEYIDAATRAKRYHLIDNCTTIRKRTTRNLCNKAFIKKDGHADNNKRVDYSQIAFDTDDLTGKNNWIAIIHADGNGVGQIVSKVGQKLDDFKEFSKALDEATVNAAVDSYNAIKDIFKDEKIIPIRPIVIGGDDFTVICRADLAIKYVTEYIKNFEKYTKDGKVGELLEKHKVFTKGKVKNRLTACAGIAYVKSSYPFYFGYELAEALCSRAKKDAKNSKDVKDGLALPPSCIMFHKVQDSFIASFDDIVKRELTPHKDVSFEFGPYYISEDMAEEKHRWTVNQLMEMVQKLDGEEGSAIKSSLRKWLSLLHEGIGVASQKLERIKNVHPSEIESINTATEGIEREGKMAYPAYDILAIHTINTQKTKI